MKNRISRFLHDLLPDETTALNAWRLKSMSIPSGVTVNWNPTAEWASAIVHAKTTNETNVNKSLNATRGRDWRTFRIFTEQIFGRDIQFREITYVSANDNLGAAHCILNTELVPKRSLLISLALFPLLHHAQFTLET